MYALPEIRNHIQSLVRFLKSLRSDGSLLEVGFGDGYLLELCHREFQCTGLDLSAANVELTRSEFEHKGIKGVTFITADIRTWSPEDYYDVVAVCHVLEHFNEEELPKVLSYLYSARRDRCLLLVYQYPPEEP